MMGVIERATSELDFTVMVLSILLFMFALKEIIELISYFKKKFGVHTVIDDNKTVVDKRLDKLEEQNRKQTEVLEQLSSSISKLNKEVIDKEILDFRFAILDMANGISEGKPYSQDSYKHTFDIFERYERILKENGMTNGQVDASMEVIEDMYKQKLQTGFCK